MTSLLGTARFYLELREPLTLLVHRLHGRHEGDVERARDDLMLLIEHYDRTAEVATEAEQPSAKDAKAKGGDERDADRGSERGGDGPNYPPYSD